MFFQEFLLPVCGLLLLVGSIIYFGPFVMTAAEKNSPVGSVGERICQRAQSEIPEIILKRERMLFSGRYFGPFEPSSLEQIATAIEGNEFQVPDACISRKYNHAEVVVSCLDEAQEPSPSFSDRLTNSKPAKIANEFLGFESEEEEIEC